MSTHSESSFSRGFDTGNYGNAYESSDWDSWFAEVTASPPWNDIENFHNEDWVAGLLLGFFSSYEIEEIADDELAETVAYLRIKHGEE